MNVVLPKNLEPSEQSFMKENVRRLVKFRRKLQAFAPFYFFMIDPLVNKMEFI